MRSSREPSASWQRAACIGCIALRFAVPAWELRAGTLTLSLVLTLVTLGAIRMSDDRQARRPTAYAQFSRFRIAFPITQSLSSSDRNDNSLVKCSMRWR